MSNIEDFNTPTPLPETDEQHRAWSKSIIERAGYPDNISFRQAVATMVLHLDASKVEAPKQQFVNELKRSVVNQTAFNIMQDCKAQQEAADEVLRNEEVQAAASQMVQEA